MLPILQRTQGIPWKAIPSWLIGNRLRVLMYHSIDNNPKDPKAIPPETFEKQMLTLAKGDYDIVSLKEGLHRLRQNLPLKRTVVLTFDDAYRDFLANALPVLEEFEFPVTLFVPVGLLGGKAIWDSYDNNKKLMNWDQLQEVRTRGATIASHTMTHPRLTECKDQELEYELKESLRILRERIDNVFPALSYPGGYYGPREKRVAQESGYVCGVGISSRWGNGPETDFYQLRREKPYTRPR